MSRRTARRWSGLLLAGVVLLAGAGCVRMPEDGPVVTTNSAGDADDSSGVAIDARPPRAGASAPDIVTGFLEAMTATPINVTVAEQFLSSDARAEWNPDASTVTYAEVFPPRARLRDNQTQVALRLVGAERLDGRGSYEGRVPESQETLHLPMVREGGEWRIAQAPDALIVPASWFEQRFRQVSLYFFDPTSRILVPEPVFVPEGEQLASALVNALLAGPGPGLRQVVTTSLPDGLQTVLSVPISEDGLADVHLEGFTGQLTPEASELIVAQLAWTLRQEPTISAFRVTIGERALTLSDGVSLFAVNDQGAQYDPTVIEASSLLYGLRDGRLVAGPPEALEQVEGPFGTSTQGLGTVAVNLLATRVAGVSAAGDRILVSSVRGEDAPVQQVVSGAEDLLRPAWDFTDRLWYVDDRRAGARVAYLAGREPVEIRVPGVSGERVTRFLVSRDGSRLVAAIRTRTTDRIMVSRIQHDPDGRVTGATRARPLATVAEPMLRVRDLGWASPTSVAVLSRLGPALSQVRTASVDGAPSGFEGLLTTLKGNVVSIAASPAEGQNLFAVTPRSLIDFTAGGVTSIDVDSGVDAVDYVG